MQLVNTAPFHIETFAKIRMGMVCEQYIHCSNAASRLGAKI